MCSVVHVGVGVHVGLGPKRARLDADLLHQQEEESARTGSPLLSFGTNLGSDRGECLDTINHGTAEEVARNAGVAGGGGCCSFLWSKDGDYQRAIQQSGNSDQSAEGGNQQHGHVGSNAAGLGGGISAKHPSGMDVVVGGDRHDTGPISEYVSDGGGAEIGIGGGSGNGIGEPGGGAVISSGFGAGGFPKHPWHQDQGGSSDDMLILYGSPS